MQTLSAKFLPGTIKKATKFSKELRIRRSLICRLGVEKLLSDLEGDPAGTRQWIEEAMEAMRKLSTGAKPGNARSGRAVHSLDDRRGRKKYLALMIQVGRDELEHRNAGRIEEAARSGHEGAVALLRELTSGGIRPLSVALRQMTAKRLSDVTYGMEKMGIEPTTEAALAPSVDRLVHSIGRPSVTSSLPWRKSRPQRAAVLHVEHLLGSLASTG